MLANAVQKATLAIVLTTAAAVSGAPSARADCPDLQVFHAAGTSESGLASVGNALAIYLPKYVKNVRVVPINYNTDPEYVVSVEQGTEEMENDVTAFAVACPNSGIAISGYSKGALLPHDSAFPEALKARVSSVVTFGDPAHRPLGTAMLLYNFDNVPTTNTACFYTFCNKGDVFCDGGTSFAAHVAYPTDGSAEKAAQQIANCYKATQKHH